MLKCVKRSICGVLTKGRGNPKHHFLPCICVLTVAWTSSRCLLPVRCVSVGFFLLLLQGFRWLTSLLSCHSASCKHVTLSFTSTRSVCDDVFVLRSTENRTQVRRQWLKMHLKPAHLSHLLTFVWAQWCSHECSFKNACQRQWCGVKCDVSHCVCVCVCLDCLCLL